MLSSRSAAVEQINATRISRQQRHFLLLELLIALFLAGTIALPLAHLPMQATQEAFKSLQRSQSQRLADNCLAKLKEKLYKNEIPWKEIAKSTEGRIVVFEDHCALDLPFLDKKFVRKATLKCVSKKKKGSEEWWLMTARIEISPEEKKSRLFQRGKQTKSFAYYVILHKSAPSSVAAPV